MSKINPWYAKEGIAAVLRGVRELTQETTDPNRYFATDQIAWQSTFGIPIKRKLTNPKASDRPIQIDIHKFMERHVQGGDVLQVIIDTTTFYRAAPQNPKPST